MATQLTLLAMALLAAAAVLPLAHGTGSAPNNCPSAPSGFYPYPGNCNQFYHCSHGTPYLKSCPPGTHWNDNIPTCVHAYTKYDTCVINNLARECANAPTQKIPDPDNCAAFFDCSDAELAGVCPTDKLFDTPTKTCVYKDWATCEGRSDPYAVETMS